MMRRRKVVSVLVGHRGDVVLTYDDGTTERWSQVVTRGQWRLVEIVCGECRR